MERDTMIRTREEIRTLTIEETQALAVRERLIEYGSRRGQLGAAVLPFTREPDGNLLIFFPQDRARIRVQPPGIGAASGVVLTAVVVVGRPVQMEISTIPVRWDASRGDWVPYAAAATGDVVAVVWEKIETLATRSGWSMPPPRT
jgi:hypothetical protein